MPVSKFLAALRLTGIEAFAGLFLLVRGEGRLAAEFDALFLGVGPAACGAFENAAAFELRRNAKDGEDDLGEVGCGIEERLGQRADTGPGALHVAGDNQKVGCVARQAVNGRGYHHVAGGELLDQCAKLRPVGGGAGDFLAEMVSGNYKVSIVNSKAYPAPYPPLIGFLDSLTGLNNLVMSLLSG
jgi:hypothetical protein